MLMLKISFPRVVLARKVTQVSEGFQIENVGDADTDARTIENNKIIPSSLSIRVKTKRFCTDDSR